MFTKVAAFVFIAAFWSAAPVGAGGLADSGSRRVVEGTIYDAATRLPIPFATVRVMGADRSTLANREGRFRVVISETEYRLKFSHIAYFSELVDLSAGDSALSHDVYLHTCMVDVGMVKVYGRAYDPGQQIIVEAIRRKEDILSKIHDYRYDAYTKLLVNDETDPDSAEIMLITETQVTAYWEQPDNYKQVITSRRQSANIEAENNLVTVGEILNFNRNRIELGRYSIVSPTAEDALDHYNYYLMDTVYLDSLAVFRLEIEPKNPDDPLFVGFIHIADSTYDVVMVDVGFSRGVEIPLLKGPRYSQRFAQFENEYWMPIEIRFSAGVEFKFPLPGIPRKLSFAHVASLYSYQFDAGHPGGTFGEYVIEVDRTADDIDSAAWFERQTIPLTDQEQAAYQRIDSVENEPPSIGKIALTGLGAAAYLLIIGEEDIFRFNRVEGPFLGLGIETDRLHDRLDLRLKTGYAFDAKRSEHQVGATYRLHDRRKLDLTFDFVNRVRHRPTIVSAPDYSPGFSVIINWYDPFDYYRVKGIDVSTSLKLVDQTRLRLGYNDVRHYSMPVNSDFSLFGDDDEQPRDNPPIVEGRLRSVAAEFRYDSRKMFNNKGEDIRIDDLQYLAFSVGIEYASPDFVDNDFDFRRYYVDIRRRQRSFGLGVTSLRLYAGASDGDLPPQRYFSVDFGDPYFFRRLGFSTLNETNFGGSRALVVCSHHNFRRRLFVASGIPLVRDIPLWLSVHGGMFWIDLENHRYREGDENIRTAAGPYRELGFGLGNLTPFLSPFNFALNFTWQLSDYDTSDFSIFLGLEL